MILYKKVTAVLLITLFCFVITACGGVGGDGGAQATEAVVTVTLTGPAATIGAVDLDVDLPIGFILSTEADGSLTPGVVTAADIMPDDTLVAANYVPEVLPAPGQLFTGIASAQGFQPGAILTVIKTLAADEELPDPADLVVVTLDVFDLGANLLVEYTVTVDVQLRPATL